MRDYLSPARKAVERVIPHPVAARSFVAKRRALVFAMAAAFLFILTLGVITVRAITGQNNEETTNAVSSEGKSSTLSTSSQGNVANDKEQPAVNESTSTNSSAKASNSNSSKTTVTINNEQVPVPENGKVERTITNDNGTTHVNVSTNNSGSAGNSYTSSFVTNTSNSSSTNMNSSITSDSQNIDITTQ